jgi:hypothetical protein
MNGTSRQGERFLLWKRGGVCVDRQTRMPLAGRWHMHMMHCRSQQPSKRAFLCPCLASHQVYIMHVLLSDVLLVPSATCMRVKLLEYNMMHACLLGCL